MKLSPFAAALRIGELVGMTGTIVAVDQVARDAAAARLEKDWGRDCGWRNDPDRAARRITAYLDSLIEKD